MTSQTTMEAGLLRLFHLLQRTLPRRTSRPSPLSPPNTSRLRMVLPLPLGPRNRLTIRRRALLTRLNRRSTGRVHRLLGLSQPSHLTIRPRQPPAQLPPQAGSNPRNLRSTLHLPGRNLLSTLHPPGRSLPSIQQPHPPGRSLMNRASTHLRPLHPFTPTLSPQALAPQSRLQATMSHRSQPWSHQSRLFLRRNRTQASTAQFQFIRRPRPRMRRRL
jgi:hypothetical protein